MGKRIIKKKKEWFVWGHFALVWCLNQPHVTSNSNHQRHEGSSFQRRRDVVLIDFWRKPSRSDPKEVFGSTPSRLGGCCFFTKTTNIHRTGWVGNGKNANSESDIRQPFVLEGVDGLSATSGNAVLLKNEWEAIVSSETMTGTRWMARERGENLKQTIEQKMRTWLAKCRMTSRSPTPTWIDAVFLSNVLHFFASELPSKVVEITIKTSALLLRR